MLKANRPFQGYVFHSSSFHFAVLTQKDMHIKYRLFSKHSGGRSSVG